MCLKLFSLSDISADLYVCYIFFDRLTLISFDTVLLSRSKTNARWTVCFPLDYQKFKFLRWYAFPEQFLFKGLFGWHLAARSIAFYVKLHLWTYSNVLTVSNKHLAPPLAPPKTYRLLTEQQNKHLRIIYSVILYKWAQRRPKTCAVSWENPATRF